MRICLCVFMCVTWVYRLREVWGWQLELQAVVSHLTWESESGAGNLTQVLCRNRKRSSGLFILLRQQFLFPVQYFTQIKPAGCMSLKARPQSVWKVYHASVPFLCSVQPAVPLPELSSDQSSDEARETWQKGAIAAVPPESQHPSKCYSSPQKVSKSGEEKGRTHENKILGQQPGEAWNRKLTKWMNEWMNE